jgi:hypothetical protein
MQALFILPMLMSVLAMAISLFAAVLAGVSAGPVIMAVDFIMLSPVQAIIAADAGETERANATKAAAVSKVFIEKSPEVKRNRRHAGLRNYVFSRDNVSRRRKFSCCNAK